MHTGIPIEKKTRGKLERAKSRKWHYFYESIEFRRLQECIPNGKHPKDPVPDEEVISEVNALFHSVVNVGPHISV